MRAFLILPLVFLIAFTSNVEGNQYDEQTSSKVIQEAEKKYKKVLKVKNAWRDTKKIIKNAKKAHKDQNYEKSVTLAKKLLTKPIWHMSSMKNRKIIIAF